MKTGAYIIALIALIVFTASCSRQQEGQKGAKEIMKDYTNTLSSAPDKARDAGDEAKARDEKMERAIKELDR